MSEDAKAKLMELAERIGPRLFELLPALEAFLDAESRALGSNSDETSAAAIEEAKRAWLGLTKGLDSNGALTTAYDLACGGGLTESSDRKSDKASARECSARVLIDLGTAVEGVAGRAFALTGEYIIERSLGRGVYDIFEGVDLKPGAPKHSVLIMGIKCRFILLVHYQSRLTGKSIEQTLADFPGAVSWATFKQNQRLKELQPALAPEKREEAWAIGKAVRNGKPLNEEQAKLREMWDADLSRPDLLKKLATALTSGAIDPFDQWVQSPN